MQEARKLLPKDVVDNFGKYTTTGTPTSDLLEELMSVLEIGSKFFRKSHS